MRKTLTQTLGAAFCAILSALSAMGGGGMMIGARTAAWAKSGGWVNPYVTDGLIAMWDGIENGWKDLVGGQIQMEFVGDHSVESDCMYLSNGGYGKIVGFSFSDPITQELVVKINEDSSSQFGRFVGENRGLTLSSNRSQLNLYGWGVDNAYAAYLNKNMRCTIALTVADHESKCYVDGRQGGSLPCGNASYSGTTTFFNRESLGRVLTGELCCVRFYNRALSAEELAANYVVDKERFDLA